MNIEDIFIYVVNLPHRKDRLDHFMDQMSKIGFPPGNIIVIPGGIPEDNQNANRYSRRGAAGCALGHFNAIKSSLDNGHDFSIIMEDDIIFLYDDFVDVTIDMFITINNNMKEYDILYFCPGKTGCGRGKIDEGPYFSNVTRFRKIFATCQHLSVEFKTYIAENEDIFLNGHPVDWRYQSLAGKSLTCKKFLVTQNKKLKSDIR